MTTEIIARFPAEFGKSYYTVERGLQRDSGYEVKTYRLEYISKCVDSGFKIGLRRGELERDSKIEERSVEIKGFIVEDENGRRYTIYPDCVSAMLVGCKYNALEKEETEWTFSKT